MTIYLCDRIPSVLIPQPEHQMLVERRSTEDVAATVCDIHASDYDSWNPPAFLRSNVVSLVNTAAAASLFSEALTVGFGSPVPVIVNFNDRPSAITSLELDDLLICGLSDPDKSGIVWLTYRMNKLPDHENYDDIPFEMNNYKDLSLDKLFAEANEIGNKYQSQQEIKSFKVSLDRLTGEMVFYKAECDGHQYEAKSLDVLRTAIRYHKEG
jgi:hypothetical protein